jgi:two-component system cell cycle response regulator
MRKPLILVVDDNKITTKLLHRYLSANGYEAMEAYDGQECLEKVAEQEPDAIVLDVMMPRLDGYQTAAKLKENPATRHIPIVIVTALNDVQNQLKAIESGADDFLSKPIEEKFLIAKVKLLSNVKLNQDKLNFLENQLDKALNGELTGKTINDIHNSCDLF